jgi:hypothetical protein
MSASARLAASSVDASIWTRSRGQERKPCSRAIACWATASDWNSPDFRRRLASSQRRRRFGRGGRGRREDRVTSVGASRSRCGSRRERPSWRPRDSSVERRPLRADHSRLARFATVAECGAQRAGAGRSLRVRWPPWPRSARRLSNSSNGWHADPGATARRSPPGRATVPVSRPGKTRSTTATFGRLGAR